MKQPRLIVWAVLTVIIYYLSPLNKKMSKIIQIQRSFEKAPSIPHPPMINPPFDGVWFEHVLLSPAKDRLIYYMYLVIISNWDNVIFNNIVIEKSGYGNN